MLLTPHRFALVMALAISTVSLSPAYARGEFDYLHHHSQPDDTEDAEWYEVPEVDTPLVDGYLIQKATSYNGLQLAAVLDPALTKLMDAELTSEEEEELEIIADTLTRDPGGMGAALEQLAGSQNANLAAATQNTTQQLGSQLLSTLQALPDTDEGHFWTKGVRNEGRLARQGGSAGVSTDTQGLMLGADWALDQAWRVGVMGAKTSSRFDAQRFDADLDSWHLGGYAVRQDGPLALRLGGIYSRHAGTNKRRIQLLDYEEQLKGSYDAQSQTLFSELGYRLGSADVSAEPFIGLGYQRYHRDSFKERGGLAALNVGSQTQQNLNSTVGLRLATEYRFDHQVSLTPHLSTRWKHLYGAVDSQVRQSYRHTPGLIDDFTITGTSLDRDSLELQAGLDLALSAQHTVGLSYSGQAGTHSRNQGLMGQWMMSF